MKPKLLLLIVLVGVGLAVTSPNAALNILTSVQSYFFHMFDRFDDVSNRHLRSDETTE
jgi:hypothetical protein